MKKELPRVFKNKIKKKLDNNKKIYVSNNNLYKKEVPSEKEEEKNNMNTKTINQKIIKIMNTKNHISKIPVRIKTIDEEISTYLIGKNKNKIITHNNETIEIEKIIDIKIDE